MKEKEETAVAKTKAKSKPKQREEELEDDPAAFRGEEVELRKKELLERNRYSAMRSRNKKRERLQRVEMDAKRVAAENDMLRQSQWLCDKLDFFLV